MKSKTRGRGAALKKAKTRNSAPRPGDVSPRPPFRTFLAGYWFSLEHPTGRKMPAEMLWVQKAEGMEGREIEAQKLKDAIDKLYSENL